MLLSPCFTDCGSNVLTLHVHIWIDIREKYSRPLIKSVFQKIIFFLNQNICCGYSKECLNETVLLSTKNIC